MASSPLRNVASPDSEVSPTSVVPPQAVKNEYFPTETNTIGDGSNTSVRASDGDDGDNSSARQSSISVVVDQPIARVSSLGSSAGDVSPSGPHRGSGISRKMSTSSVTFREPYEPRRPSLTKRESRVVRPASLRGPSPPPPQKFKQHVAFDNVIIGEATKNNTPSLTLNYRHKGYQAKRKSRTFMVGVDEHTYSDYALQWLLDELVDDGDEVVCVRVVEKEIRPGDNYQEEAKSMMEGIQRRNTSNRAISIVLEYAVGKLHGTFQKLIQVYSPGMLIVGTKGRSLGGIQGLVNTRNSFSKYCLQYSPIPVVVVRPTEKRVKKKTKRANDSTRQTYVGMLAANQGKHEADSEASSTYGLETKISADEEAHQVARALGLPAAYDPTIKPIDPGLLLHPRSPGPASINQLDDTAPEDQRVVKEPSNTTADSEDDEEDEYDGFETMSGQQALNMQKKEQLHKMEVGEAAALKMKIEDEDDEDDDEEPSNQKVAS